MGSYAIQQGTLALSNNYALTYVGANLTITKASTTTVVASSVNSSVFGQSVTFPATVGVVSPGAGSPTGTVTFYDGSTPLGTGTLNGSKQATFTTTSLAVASHTITATYTGGDGNFNASPASAAITQVVSKANTTTVVASSANPSAAAQSVTFTATVSAVAPGSGTPTGTVTFKDGSTVLGSGTLSGGVATLTTSSLTVGSHSITATYTSGDGNFNASPASAAITQTVKKADTTTLTSSVNPSKSAQQVVFTATVSPVNPKDGTPTGTVTFKDGNTMLVVVNLDKKGTATFVTKSLTSGSHQITAAYSGDSNFAVSSGSLNQVVK